MHLDNNSQKNDALILLQKCISLNPSDAEVYGAIANILADLKLHETAYTAFKQALEHAPTDPYIIRNYSLALIENGKYFEGLTLALEMYEKFPLLGDTYILFVGHFQRCIQYGVLSNEQIIELQTKWDSLN
jgi:tetratricopeptide (TPR) repeat protein